MARSGSTNPRNSARAARPAALPAPRARAFTIVEMLLVLLVIFAIMGLLIGGVRHLSSHARATADRAAVLSLKQAVEQFRQQMGFIPPLVKDLGEPAGPGAFGGEDPLANGRPRVYVPSGADLTFLRRQPRASTADFRFSVYTLPYYIVGALDTDGVQGPGFRGVKPDGSFETAGRKFDPFFDVSRTSTAVYAIDAQAGKVLLRDRNGVAYRYYRWEHGQPGQPGTQLQNLPQDLNVPMFLGDATENPELKAAKFAIVGAGPNGVFGNEHQIHAVDPSHPQAIDRTALCIKLGLDPSTATDGTIWDKASADNIVEIGR